MFSIFNHEPEFYFQMWGMPIVNPKPAHFLGFINLVAEAPLSWRRWRRLRRVRSTQAPPDDAMLDVRLGVGEGALLAGVAEQDPPHPRLDPPDA